ncbi:CHASE2 domain-containing protein [Neosynechococcus sphagnicola]|uniref:CHASE2 domain-containing protein n=1 Tax=Neosynechococcus sphagnicola TaxID=1501145 RepID=UPI0009E029DA|nr:CHASE2 domain-containing serine/threonine-protein kinase [Neosynechococcus sphagnicola]
MTRRETKATIKQDTETQIGKHEPQKAWLLKLLPLLRSGMPMLLTSGIMTLLVVGLRYLGVLQGVELVTFDAFVRLQPEEAPDPRLLVVTITEEDIQRQKKWPISDQALNQALGKLEQAQPLAIGLDLYRDLPVEPGHRELATRFQTSDVIVPVCKVRTKSVQGVAPPPGVPMEAVGFSDIVIDPDNVVRRNLISMTEQRGKCTTTNSLGLQLALSYLVAQGIEPQLTPQNYLQLGSAVFRPLHENDGGYRRIDAQGHQILLRYRSPQQVARMISLTDVLQGQFRPDWVKDKLVLLGVSALSVKDTFLTPYSAGQQEDIFMPGVVLHAQMTSQILSAVLDGRSLFWYWPKWGEGLWILGWALVGGTLAWWVRHPLQLGALTAVALGSLAGGCYVIFLKAGWVPVIPPAIALVGTAGSLVTYAAYKAQISQKQIAEQSQEQDKAIALLQAMLKESREAQSDAVPETTPIADSLNTLLSGRYRIKKVLGAGGFGQTYLAEDTKRPGNPLCVVKHLRPARKDPKFLQVARRLFNTEAEILEQLGQHNRIPQLLAYFEENKEFYLVEEFVQGHSLSNELVPGKQLSEARVIEMLRGILEVLAFIHHHRIIHRDIKPGNIIRRQSDNRLVLIDFGAVKQIRPPEREEEESNTVVIGTPGYAPAEQLSGQPGLSSDVYALGVIGIQGLTGLVPKQFQKDPRTGEILWQHLAKVSPQLSGILDKMVRYYFSDRYQSAAEALQDLERLTRSLPKSS